MPEYFYPLIKNVELNGKQLEIPNVQHSADSNFRFYVDCINGDDSYIGTGKIEDDEFLGSKSHPFRTLDKFFDLCNEIKSDIRCYLVSPGLYTISKDRHASFVGIAVHITALADNITLYFEPKTVSYPFYDCHLNLRGASPNTIEEGYPDHQVYMTIAGEGFYMDAGNCSIENCIFTNRISAFYGGGYHISNCTVNYLRFRYANVQIGNLTLNGATGNEHPLSFLSCNLTLRGTLSGTVANNSNRIDILHLENTNAWIDTNPDDLTFTTSNCPYIHGINARASTLNINRGSYAYFRDHSALGIRMTRHTTGSNLIIGDTLGINATGSYTYKGNISNFNTIRLFVEFPNNCYHYFDIANSVYAGTQNFNFKQAMAGADTTLSVIGSLTDADDTADTEQTGTITITTWDAPATAKISHIYGVNL